MWTYFLCPLQPLRQCGSHAVIDMITVNLDIKHDCYVSDFSNLGLRGIPIDEEFPTKYDRLLCGGIWFIVQLDYEFIEEERNGTSIHICKLTPIQMPHVDIDELKAGRVYCNLKRIDFWINRNSKLSNFFIILLYGFYNLEFDS